MLGSIVPAVLRLSQSPAARVAARGDPVMAASAALLGLLILWARFVTEGRDVELRRVRRVEAMYRRRYAGHRMAWLRAEIRIYYAGLVCTWRVFPKPYRVTVVWSLIVLAGSIGGGGLGLAVKGSVSDSDTGNSRVTPTGDRRTTNRKTRPRVGAKTASKSAFQLDFLASIDNNARKMGTPVLVAPTPPNQDGGCISTMTSTQRTTAPTYSQAWSSYNRAQQNEKDRFLVLLQDICSAIPQEPRPRGRGRPSAPLSERLFSVVFKVYTGFSARRFTSDVQSARQQGLIDHAPHFNSTNRYLASASLTKHLQALIELSASPLASIETDFAIDSTGFATTTYNRWFDHKWGRERTKQDWVKTHLMCGVKTNIVTAALATNHESADIKQLPDLLKWTAKNFSIDEVSADKAYSSKRNLREIEAIGAIPYIPFKSFPMGSQGKGHRYDSLWAKMWHFYSFNREEFNAHYHKRSNVETSIAMIKTKFGAGVKSKTGTAQVNEVLCKVLCHNICVLIHSFYELGIAPDFAVQTEPEPKIIDLNQYRARVSL